MTRELLDKANEISTTVPPLNGTTANGSNPNGGVVTWRSEQQRQAADSWIYNDAALRQAMTSLGIPVSPGIHEDFAPGVPIPGDRPGQIVDPRPLLLDTDASKKARADVAAKLGVSEKALIDGIHAEHGITNTLPRTTPPSTTTTTTTYSTTPGAAGTPFKLKTDPFTIKTARAEITGEAAALEAKRKEFFDAMSVSTDPHMATKKAAYEASSAANAGWDAKNPEAQLKINQNYTLGHEVRLQVNSAAEDLLTQIKGIDAAEAINNLKATASHPDLAKYKELQAKYDQLASQGKWREASEVLVEQHTLVQGKSELISAIAADRVLADLGGDSATVTAESIDAAITKRKDDSAKVNADLKRLEIREYDVRLVMLKPPPAAAATTNPPVSGSGSVSGNGSGGTPGGSGGAMQGPQLPAPQPVTPGAALPLLSTPVTNANAEALLRIQLDGTTQGLIINAQPEASTLGLKNGDQIVGITGSRVGARIQNPTNENIRDSIWGNQSVELEVKRKDTGIIEKIRIKIWKDDPNGRYKDGVDSYEEDVRVLPNTGAFGSGTGLANVTDMTQTLGASKVSDAKVPVYTLGCEKVREGGSKLDQIDANSFLDKAGFKDNDMITWVGNNKVKKPADLEKVLQSELASMTPGSTKNIVFSFDRDTVGLIGRPMNHRARLTITRKADGTFDVKSTSIERRENTAVNSLTLGIATWFGAPAWEWVKV